MPERVGFSGCPVKVDVERTATRMSCIDLIKEACNSTLRVTLNGSLDGLGGRGRLICARNDLACTARNIFASTQIILRYVVR